MTMVATGAHRDASRLRFGDRRFRSHHHRGIAEPAIAVHEHGGIRFLDHGQLWIAIQVTVPQRGAVALDLPGAVGSNPAQVAIGQQLGQLVGVIGAQARRLEAGGGQVSQLVAGNAGGFFGWDVHDSAPPAWGAGLMGGNVSKTPCAFECGLEGAWKWP